MLVVFRDHVIGVEKLENVNYKNFKLVTGVNSQLTFLKYTISGVYKKLLIFPENNA